jgi:arylsulfatase A-like enzyme
VKTAALAASALLVAGLGAACSDAGSARNAIVVSLDTLRADHLGVYGHSRPTSPQIDRLAAESVVFERAQATSSWTLPSHASLLTGLYPSRHGARTASRQIVGDVPTLASILSGRGFATAAVVNGVLLEPRYGLARGFDSYSVVPEDQSRAGAAHEVTRRALDWLRMQGDRRFFLFVHYFDLHSDYASLERYERLFDPPPGRTDGTTDQLMTLLGARGAFVTPDELERLERLYDAGIRQLDDEVGRLLRALRRGGWLEQSVFVLTSDHGEEFQEHGRFLHGITHFDEVLRVPLIVRLPQGPRGLRVAAPVSGIDVMPTLLGLLGVPVPEGLDGVDLRAQLRGEAAPADRPLLAETGPGSNRDALRSLRDARFKLVLDRRDGRRSLYDLAADPGEQRDVSAEHPEVVARMVEVLARHAERERIAPVAPEPSREVRERLRALGYAEEASDAR